MAVHLDDGVAAGGVVLPEEVQMDAALHQGLPQEAALLADDAGMPDGEPRPGHGDGLIEALAAAVDLAAQAGPGLPRLDELVHGIDIVKVQGTEIQDLHCCLPYLRPGGRFSSPPSYGKAAGKSRAADGGRGCTPGL